MDLVAIAERLKPVADWLAANWPIVALALSAYFLFIWSRDFRARLASVVEKIAFSNWQLAVLGATGIVLSLASGWTTWDGMRNFTNEPVLSLMITFGIQGVMLIVAWLIGESFASGMNTAQSGRRSDRPLMGLEWFIGAGLGIFIVASIIFLLIRDTQSVAPLFSLEQKIFAAVAVAAIALIAVFQGELLKPYLQSTKIILRNAVLWVMFLACMATSVFFSFDSLFSTIFPQSERERAAELRAQNQVAGIISDIGQTIATRRLQEADALFRSDGWQTYERQLDELATKAQGSQRAIEEYLVQQMEERRRAIAAQEERKYSAQSQQAGLERRLVQLNEEISRLQTQRPTASAAVEEQRRVVNEIERRLDEQRAIVLAEERGVEGTGKVGRGPQWREEKAKEQRVASELEVANRRLAAPRERLVEIDKRLGTLRAEIFQVEGDLAQLKGEAQTAEQRIEAAQASTLNEEAAKVDPARVLPAFERAQLAFRQEPTRERLDDLRQQCTQLLNAMASTPSTKDSVRSIDCDPKTAAEAAAIVFGLNEGTRVFLANCAGGERLEKQGSTDALFGFARGCLADSGLPSQDTDQLRAKINLAELNRDDKAHRFVVTWNAFTDGNRLAYLALAIAIAIDALVFMSGLFGANAVRSPLQDVPRHQPRSAQQLEAVIEAALQPHPYENARATIEAMAPITAENGFTQEVVISPQTSHRNAIVSVLNAGATIGAVARDSYDVNRYLVRPEMFEYLSLVMRRQYETNEEHRRLAELNRIITVALQPHVGDNAEALLDNLHPINESNGYTSEVFLDEVPAGQKPLVKRALNAAAVLNFVRRDSRKEEPNRYYVHKDLYKTIALIAAAYPSTGLWRGHAETGLPAPAPAALPRDTGPAPAAQGHDLTPPKKQVAAPRTRLLTDRSHGTGDETPHRAEHAAPPLPPPPEEEDSFAGHDDDFEFDRQRHFEDAYLEALEFDDLDALHERLDAPGVRAAAMDAWRVLRRHSNEHARLDEFVSAFRQEPMAVVAETYSRQRSEIGGDPELIDVLERADRQINDDLPILLMMPEMGLIPDLVDKLEQAVVYDPSFAFAADQLRERLVEVDKLIRFRDLSEPANWNRIRQILDTGSDDGEDEPSRRNGGSSGNA